MTMTKNRSKRQRDLSDYLNEDVIIWIKRRKNVFGNTYPEIAKMLSQSGWDVKATTIARWMSYERNGR